MAPLEYISYPLHQPVKGEIEMKITWTKKQANQMFRCDDELLVKRKEKEGQRYIDMWKCKGICSVNIDK
jgi:hypothetical protein